MGRNPNDNTRAHQELVGQILLLASHIPGCRAFPMKVGAGVTWRGAPIRFGVPGMFDIMALVGPRHAWLEVKTGKGKLTPEQLAFQKMIRSLGGVAEEVRDVVEAAAVLSSLLPERDEPCVNCEATGGTCPLCANAQSLDQKPQP